MNSLHPYRAFAIQQCPSPCTDSPVFSPGCRYKGVDATSCDAAQKQFNSKNKTGVINEVPLDNDLIVSTINNNIVKPVQNLVSSRNKQTHTPTPINQTGTTSVPGGGTVFAPSSSSDPISNITSGIQDAVNNISDFTIPGLPPSVFGLSTPILLGIGVGGLLLLLVLRR